MTFYMFITSLETSAGAVFQRAVGFPSILIPQPMVSESCYYECFAQIASLL